MPNQWTMAVASSEQASHDSMVPLAMTNFDHGTFGVCVCALLPSGRWAIELEGRDRVGLGFHLGWMGLSQSQ